MWTKGSVGLVYSREVNQSCQTQLSAHREQEATSVLNNASILVLLMLGNMIMFSLAAYGLYNVVQKYPSFTNTCL